MVCIRYLGFREGVYSVKMSGDLTHLLSSSSRLDTDVTFNLQSVSFPAHKCILANALPAFHTLFFGCEADPLLYSVDVEVVSPQAFRVFLHQVYGRTVEVDTLSFHTLVELHWLAVNYQDGRFITQLVSKMEEMVERQTEYETLSWWQDLVITYKVDKLQLVLENKRTTGNINGKDLETVVEVAGDKYIGCKVRSFSEIGYLLWRGLNYIITELLTYGINLGLNKTLLICSFTFGLNHTIY